MVRRLVLFLTALSVVAGPALAAAPAASVSSDGVDVWSIRSFSPNGDERWDEAVVRYRLPESGSVTVIVSHDYTGKIHRIVRLGYQSAGRHVWHWDGRGMQRTTLPDDRYRVTVKLTAADGSAVTGWHTTYLDTAINSRVRPRYVWSLNEDAVQTVFPRTTAVRDSIALRPIFEGMRWAELVIKNRAGRIVLRRDVSDTDDNGADVVPPDHGPHPGDVVWTARFRGKPLARGRYHAFIRGQDDVGNVGRGIGLRIWVSGDALEWREETRVVTPAESARHRCAFRSCGGIGPPDCGSVAPSEIYPGGHSYRSRECSTEAYLNVARGVHYLPLPEAVRGVSAAKVAFVGRPTHVGESDTGNLYLPREDLEPGATVTSSTGGGTEWVDCPRMCRGEYGVYPDVNYAVDPGVVWSFRTYGTDSVDVATFTVTARYLAVAD